MQINSVGQWRPSWTSRGQRVWTQRLQCPADVCTCPGRVGNQSSHIKMTGVGAEMFAMQFVSTRGLSYTRLSRILASGSVFDLWWFFWLCFASFIVGASLLVWVIRPGMCAVQLFYRQPEQNQDSYPLCCHKDDTEEELLPLGLIFTLLACICGLRNSHNLLFICSLCFSCYSSSWMLSLHCTKLVTY